MKLNVATLKFISLLNNLAEQSKNGIKPISKFTDEDKVNGCLAYDDRNPIRENEFYTYYPFTEAFGMGIDSYEPYTYGIEPFNYFGGHICGVKISGEVYVSKEDGDTFITIDSDDSDVSIEIRNGHWDTVEYFDEEQE